MELRPLSRLAALLLLITVALLAVAQQQALPVPLGTRLDLTLNTPLSSQFSQPGDQFTADVADGPYKSAIVHGTVRSVSQSGHFKGSAEILLSFDRIVLRDGRRSTLAPRSYRFTSTATRSETKAPSKARDRANTPGCAPD